MTTEQQVQAGVYGPFTLSWDGRSGLWIVTAQSQRALNLFNVGRKVTLGDAANARVFGDVDRLKKRAMMKFLEVAKNCETANIIASNDEAVSLHGLKISATNDGLVMLSGAILPMYRDKVTFKGKADPADFSSSRRSTCYLSAEIAEKTLIELKAVEKDILALTDELKLPDLLWCRFHQMADGSVLVTGRIVVLGGLWGKTDPYQNKHVFPAHFLDNEISKISRRIEIILQLELSETFDGVASVADNWIAEFNSSLQKEQMAGPDYCVCRDGSWILMKAPYALSNPHLFNSFGWRWCYQDSVWIFNIIQAPTRDEFLERLVPMLRYFVDDLTPTSFLSPNSGADVEKETLTRTQ